MFLKISQILQENTCLFLTKLQAWMLLSSYEICEIFKNTFYEEHLLKTASTYDH